MMLLLDDKYAPITSEIGFMEADCTTTVSTFVGLQRPLLKEQGTRLRSRQISGTLEEVIQRLLPLTSTGRTRHLFVPTANGWTACFDNGWRGTDAGFVMILAMKARGRGIRMAAVRDTIRGTGKTVKGRYGAVILEIYGPDSGPIHNLTRSISALNDGGKWIFDTFGAPLPFEKIECYKARRIADRFTFEILQEHLREMGLDPFDESFYLPHNGAVLVEKKGRLHPDIREHTLAEARANY